MEQHSFSDFSYAVNKTSAKNGYKEVLVCFIYNGVEVLRKIYIPEKEGTSYVFEAKKIIDQEIKSGVLASYSYKFVKRKEAKNGKPNKKWIAITAGIAAVAIAGMSVGMYFVGKNSIVPAPAPVDIDYNVLLLSNDCRLSESSVKIKEGEKFSSTLTAILQDKKPSIISIAMGDKYLESKDYTFDDNTYKLDINVGATADIYISAKGVNLNQLIANATYSIKEDGTAEADGLDHDNRAEITEINIQPTTIIDGVEYEVTSIKPGLLNGCGSLETLNVPFVGCYKDGTQPVVNGDEANYTLFGAIFGKKHYHKGKEIYQTYYEEDIYRERVAILPEDLSDVNIISDTAISLGAFSGCSMINDISFAKDVKIKDNIINNYAFNGCSNLESVTLPSSTPTIIGDSAFNGCKSLLRYDLTGVESIGENAFNSCSSINSIFIPTDTVNVVGDSAFSNLTGFVLLSCSSSSELPEGWSKNWTNTTTPIIYGSQGDVDIKDNDTFAYITTSYASGEETKNGAFILEYLGVDGDQFAPEVTIPEKIDDLFVIGLSAQAFAGFTKINTITFESTELSTIGNYCFYGCTGLKNLVGISACTKLTTLGAGAFMGCVQLEIEDTITGVDDNPTFPTSLQTIGNSAFEGCSSIKSIDFGSKKIEEIDDIYSTFLGDAAFKDCDSLTGVRVSADTVNFGIDEFNGCENFTGVHVSEYNSQLDALLGTGFTAIPDRCFKGTSIQDSQAIIPYYVEEIGAGAFEDCANLTKVTLPDRYAIPDVGGYYDTHLKIIGDGAFKNCVNLTSVVSTNSYGQIMNNSLEKIGAEAFKNCAKFTTFGNTDGDLSPSLSFVGDQAFYKCSSLSALTFNYAEGVSDTLQIGEGAFYGWITAHGTATGRQGSGHTYETDTANFVAFSKGWLKLATGETYTPINEKQISTGTLKTYTTKFNYVMQNKSSTYSTQVLGYDWQTYGGQERYMIEDFGNNGLYVHIVNR